MAGESHQALLFCPHDCNDQRGEFPQDASASLKIGSMKQKLVLSNEVAEVETMINAGKPAPDFSAPAYYQGKFTHIGLSQYRDRWVVLYFYGGDYTFV